MTGIESAYWEYPKIVDWLNDKNNDKDKFAEIFKEIHAKCSENLIDTSVKLLDRTFAKLYDSIDLQTPYDFDIDELY